jgi:hypothetical protein
MIDDLSGVRMFDEPFLMPIEYCAKRQQQYNCGRPLDERSPLPPHESEHGPHPGGALPVGTPTGERHGKEEVDQCTGRTPEALEEKPHR